MSPYIIYMYHVIHKINQKHLTYVEIMSLHWWHHSNDL